MLTYSLKLMCKILKLTNRSGCACLNLKSDKCMIIENVNLNGISLSFY